MSAARPPVSESSARGARRGAPALVLVLLASLGLSTFIALALPLLDPDEGRNAEVAREMAVGGDWWVPHLAGMPYLDKPPAFFWLVALSVRRFGHTPLAARMPSIIASLIVLALVGRAARGAGNDRFAWIAMALLASAPLFAGLSAYVIFDMLLTLCVTVVWLGIAREVVLKEASSPRRLAMFAAIALGILTKGPVMLAWAIGGSLGAALLVRSRAPLRWMAWWPGWIVALGVPGLWFWKVSAQFPEFPHYALIEETFERVSTGSFHRQQPWWFVPAVLIGGALPWSLLTPWSRAGFGRATAAVRTYALTGLGFVLFAAIFFTVSHSKLVTYLLPAFPPLAWTAAAMWNELIERRPWKLLLGASLGFTALAAVIGIPIARDPYRDPDVVSGEPLARAIEAQGGGPVFYERCYSPGTDFLLDRISTLISESGRETTSNYLIRYHRALEIRGLWKAIPRAPQGSKAYTLVRFEGSSQPPPAGAAVLHRDRVFIAYHIGSTAPAGTTPTP
ncbi:MAG TPA: glycosyltransferase family 39 protein [Candidatus Udaeobacter sp.]|jgi:4-amino-4-deoxy-L-arabinose transferase-like glycosyltransferase|nr:glycosyltransferase family 39 protein [Candidatus Udaeobacter sp.]